MPEAVVQREASTLLKKKTLAQVIFCEFCEISKNTFFHRTPLVAASVMPNVTPNLMTFT